MGKAVQSITGGGGNKIFGGQSNFDLADPLGIGRGNPMLNPARRMAVDPLGLFYTPPETPPSKEQLQKEAAERERKAAADAEAGRAASLVAPQSEYDKRYVALASQRSNDMSSFGSRLKEWGFSEDSSAFATGVQSITSSYDQKLADLGSDPYFSDIRKQTGWT